MTGGKGIKYILTLKEKGEENSRLFKKLGILLRVLFLVEGVLRTGNLVTWFPRDSENSIELLDVRAGKFEFSKVVEKIQNKFKELSEEIEKSQKIPETVSEDTKLFLSLWVKNMRKKFFMVKKKIFPQKKIFSTEIVFRTIPGIFHSFSSPPRPFPRGSTQPTPRSLRGPHRGTHRIFIARTEFSIEFSNSSWLHGIEYLLL